MNLSVPAQWSQGAAGDVRARLWAELVAADRARVVVLVGEDAQASSGLGALLRDAVVAAGGAACWAPFSGGVAVETGFLAAARGTSGDGDSPSRAAARAFAGLEGVERAVLVFDEVARAADGEGIASAAALLGEPAPWLVAQ